MFTSTNPFRRQNHPALRHATWVSQSCRRLGPGSQRFSSSQSAVADHPAAPSLPGHQCPPDWAGRCSPCRGCSGGCRARCGWCRSAAEDQTRDRCPKVRVDPGNSHRRVRGSVPGTPATISHLLFSNSTGGIPAGKKGCATVQLDFPAAVAVLEELLRSAGTEPQVAIGQKSRGRPPLPRWQLSVEHWFGVMFRLCCQLLFELW